MFFFNRDKYIPDDMKLQVKEVTETYVDAIMFGTSTEVWKNR